MTNIKNVLLTSAALVMISGAAFAGGRDNDSFTNQNGTRNTLEIYQDQTRTSKVGSEGNAAQQTGFGNYLKIDQDGANQKVGATGGDFEQRGAINAALIQQSGNGNDVRNVLQTSVGEASAATNELLVNQSGSNNVVDRVSQDNYIGGQSNQATITQSASRNTVSSVAQLGNGNGLTITQGGGDSNLVRATGQQNVNGGDGNTLAIAQTGRDNLVNSAGQWNTGGARNTANVSFTGSNNGKGEFTIRGFGNNYGTGSDLFQVGANNGLTATFTGNSNTFGFYQAGENNVINASVTGNDNEVAVSQFENLQTANVTVNGNNNDVGILQSGASNTANVSVGTLSGSSVGNTAVVSQSGSFNTSNVYQ